MFSHCVKVKTQKGKDGMNRVWQPTLGALRLDQDKYQFRVWAPNATRVDLELQTPQARSVPMVSAKRGYFEATVEGVASDARYTYRLDGGDPRPDPVSRYQPEGVHGPSQLVDAQFEWHDAHWSGLALADYIIYELHVGTFTPEGTLDAIIGQLDDLRELGVTAIELMPLAQFPGTRNWGYDGVDLFAVQNSYGGVLGLKRLVDACHQRGLAVLIDVVYNHFGPEGNYWREFGAYFNERYHSAWGAAINFDGPASDEVRKFFIENALYWINDCHIDALRLDATDAYIDFSAYPFIEELADAVRHSARQLHRQCFVMAENDRNDARLTRPVEQGGYGVDAQWVDDFHHALHTVLTHEQAGYYQDYGEVRQLARALRDGFVYTGDYSDFRKTRRGSSTRQTPAWRFVVTSQNHDQVGNRLLGERLSHLISFEGAKVAASLVLLSPYIPLLFMGEDYAETAPFLYFTDHSDPDLIDKVRKGRRDEFAAFHGEGEAPDPGAEETLIKSRLDHSLKQQGKHKVMRSVYQELIRLRTTLPALTDLSKEHMEVIVYEKPHWILMRRWHREHEVVVLFSVGHEPYELSLPIGKGHWRKQFDTSDPRWQSEPNAATDGNDSVAGGVSLPDTFDSDGELSVTIAPLTVVLFEKEA